MTLAAISPLYTWWPLALAVLLFIVKVICPVIVRRQELPWPPPIVLMVSPGLRDWLVETVSWSAPDPATRVA
jgi:hypothetical protein